MSAITDQFSPKPAFDAIAFWAALDALGARDVLPDGIPDEPPLALDEDIPFDWLPEDPDGAPIFPLPAAAPSL